MGEAILLLKRSCNQEKRKNEKIFKIFLNLMGGGAYDVYLCQFFYRGQPSISQEKFRRMGTKD